MYHPDNYGFYTYNGIKTYSKYEVMRFAETPKNVQWNYNDEFFSSFDWTKEPSESLLTLYVARAMALRQKYDYLILMYSGGSDSGNILETFVRNGIHLDEICQYTNVKGSGDPNDFKNKEVFSVAYPKVQRYIEEFKLSTKSRIVDITDGTLNTYNEKTKFDFVHFINSYSSPNGVQRSKFYKNVKEWRELVTAGKKIAFIWGCDKPRIRGVGDKFYFYFTDILDGSINLRDQHLGYDGPVDELFYWAPTTESVKIMIKQAHVIKNELKNNYFKILMYQKKYQINEEVTVRYVNNMIYNREIMLGGNLLKYLIYPFWNHIDECNLKTPRGHFLSDADMWFWKNSNERSVQIYLNGIQHFTNTINSSWISKWNGGLIEFEGRKYPRRIVKLKSKEYEI